jgi:hypothetical protein
LGVRTAFAFLFRFAARTLVDVSALGAAGSRSRAYVVVAFAVVVVVVTGGVSGNVVDGAGGGVDVPSTPLLGCGGAFPMPFADGVSDFVAGGCVISGGAF